MKLIHTADLHLGMEPDKGKPWSQSRGKELWKTFYRIVDVCREEKADLLLIAGDLFHRQPLVKEWKEVNRAFDTIPETTVVLIAVNHDYLSVRSCGLKLERADNLVLFQEEEWSRFCLEKFPVYLYGFSYHGRKVPERSITEVIPGTEEGYHILIAHGG